MAEIHRLPMQVAVYTTPTELRQLADKMAFESTKPIVQRLGRSTLIDQWSGRSAEILFHYDQDKPHIQEKQEMHLICGSKRLAIYEMISFAKVIGFSTVGEKTLYQLGFTDVDLNTYGLRLEINGQAIFQTYPV